MSNVVAGFIRMRVFRGVKKWPTYHVAVPTGNALASQRSIFRENRLKFRPSSTAEKVSIVCGTNNHVRSEMSRASKPPTLAYTARVDVHVSTYACTW